MVGFFGANYLSRAAGTGASIVRWRPVVPGDGQYEVRVSYTAASNRATNAPYTVDHQGGTTTVAVNQKLRGTPDVRGGEWASLGVFTFAAGLDSTIELTDNADGYVVADAVRFLRK